MVLKYFHKNYKNDTNITIGKFQTLITKLRHSQHFRFEIKFGMIQIIECSISKNSKILSGPRKGTN
jgi:hypothetical protein